MRRPGVQREDLEVRPSPIHGNGLFTRRAIRKGTYIIEYIGEKITKEESKRRLLERNPYIFDLDEEWDLDGNVPENLARFINHSYIVAEEFFDEVRRREGKSLPQETQASSA